jgi:hypothetical protein
MLGNRKLYLDTFCEVYDLLRPLADGEFWDFGQVQVEDDSTYLISRKEFYTHVDRIRHIAATTQATIVFSNPHEGSWTMHGQLDRLGITDLVRAGRILLVSGGVMEPEYPNLMYDSFLPKPLDYAENLAAQTEYHAAWTDQRPYKFLFLNGRARPHRRALLQRLEPLLGQALWTNLDSAAGTVQTLPAEYEYPAYRNNTTQAEGYVKYDLFGNEWGEIYLTAAPYRDSYFSLVTETVFEYPYTFRTEKTAKPLMMGHPFIVAANTGFYRDLRNLGFKTFHDLVDETFDAIEDNALRLERVAAEVEWICSQDLAAFAREAYNVCKYNQQHQAELAPKIRKDFPERFQQFIHERPRV